MPNNSLVWKACRYIISGGTAAVVNLGTLYVLTRFFSVWYLAASVVAFVLSLIVSFTLQRTWTFRVYGNRAIMQHSSLYLLAALFNLALNTFILFLLVQYGHAGYIFAQFIAGVIVAFESYFLYRAIFRL
jgi:putative flippase GtrA